MKAFITLRLALVATAVLLSHGAANAQNNVWTGGDTGADWTVDTNWDELGQPLPLLDERGIIGSTLDGGSQTASASVTSDIRASDPSSTVVLGDAEGRSGTLNITSTGKLAVVTQDASSGDFFVGLNGGLGVLNVAPGGELEIAASLISTTGANGSSINLTGNASITAAAANFGRSLVIDGSSVNLSISGNATFESSGTHTWIIPAAGASVVSVGGDAELGGTLRPEFPDGTPTVGSTWNLIDATTVDGSTTISPGFDSVDSSAISGLGPGQRFAVQVVADNTSANGLFAQLVLQQQPVLVVNRQTGSVAIQNPGAAASVAFDTYEVVSGQGSLNGANWTSLAPADGWQQANPNANALSELNPLSAQAVPASTTIELGDIFNPGNRPFGDDNEDIQFNFAPTGDGLVSGLVIYEGIPTDTLTLNVDRTTGQAQIINGFRNSVSIDVYEVLSASQSLDVSPGGWQAVGGDWQVADDTTGLIAELNPLSSLDLASNAAQLLGNLYDFDAAGAEEDLVFRFALPGEDFVRTGKVVFGDELTVLDQGLPGDFNGDGFVDAIDYAVWRDNLGSNFDLAGNGDETGGSSGVVDTADYALWKSQFGANSAASNLAAIGAASGAPEPGAIALLLLAAAAVLPTRLKK